MTYEIAERARRRTRRALILAAIVTVAAITLVAVLLLIPGGPDVATAEAGPGTTAPAGASGTPRATGSARATPSAVTYQDLVGLQLPVTPAGPKTLSGSAAYRFDRSPAGAAAAALHVYARISPSVGAQIFAQTFFMQVTGSGREPLEAAVRESYRTTAEAQGIENGSPLGRRANATYPAYKVSAFSDKSAVVHLLAVVSDGDNPQTFHDVKITMRWVDLPWGEDWVLVAPESGEWSTDSISVPQPKTYTLFDPQTGGR